MESHGFIDQRGTKTALKLFGQHINKVVGLKSYTYFLLISSAYFG